MDLSVVIPVLNEEENVGELTRRISESVDGKYSDYEIIFVDDGSSDNTVNQLRTIQETYPRVRIISLRKNFGQTPAMRAGIDHSKGTIIVTLDGDLQNDPTDIPVLVEKLKEGFDLVAGWRLKRKDPFLSRKLPSMIANKIIGFITGVPIRDNGCSLKAYRANIIKEIPLYSEMHRFIPAMSTLAGVKIAQIPVNHHPRIHGQSKYGLSRTGKVILDLISVKMLISSFQKPLHWFGILSIPFIILSILSGLYYLFMIFDSSRDHLNIVVPSICILFGFTALQLIFTGLLADLIVKTGKRHDFYSFTRAKGYRSK